MVLGGGRNPAVISLKWGDLLNLVSNLHTQGIPKTHHLVGIDRALDTLSDSLCMSKCENTISSFILSLQIGQAIKPSSV